MKRWHASSLDTSMTIPVQDNYVLPQSVVATEEKKKESFAAQQTIILKEKILFIALKATVDAKDAKKVTAGF